MAVRQQGSSPLPSITGGAAENRTTKTDPRGRGGDLFSAGLAAAANTITMPKATPNTCTHPLCTVTVHSSTTSSVIGAPARQIPLWC
jgi:hypothetical protein